MLGSRSSNRALQRGGMADLIHKYHVALCDRLAVVLGQLPLRIEPLRRHERKWRKTQRRETRG